MHTFIRLLAASVLISAAAGASILTFDITDLYGNRLLNNSTIPGEYGDNITSETVTANGKVFRYLQGTGWTGNVTVDYWTRVSASGVEYEAALDYYYSGYGDLKAVAIASNNQSYVAEVVLRAAPNYLVRLEGFDLVARSLTPVVTPVTVGDVTQQIEILPGWHYSWAAALEAPTVVIRFGENTNIVGMDNLSFSEIFVATPEPGTLLLAGVALLVLVRQTRR